MRESVRLGHVILVVLALLVVASGCAVAPSIVTPELAPAVEGQEYSSDIRVNHKATLPVTWDLLEGPAGIELAEAGRACVLTWKKPIAGRISISVSARNKAGSDVRPFDLAVAEASPKVVPPEIAPVDIEPVNVGANVSIGLLTSVGTAPIDWTIAQGPVGLAVSSDGVLTWVPSAPGEFECLIRASNQAGQGELSLSISVKSTPEYEEGKKIGALLEQDAPDFVPGQTVLFLRENPEPEARAAYEFGLEAVLGDELTKLIHAAASEGADTAFGTGNDLGQKLATGKISDADARSALKQSMLTGEVALLAWQAGFLKGYGEGGLAIYRGLIISLR